MLRKTNIIITITVVVFCLFTGCTTDKIIPEQLAFENLVASKTWYSELYESNNNSSYNKTLCQDIMTFDSKKKEIITTTTMWECNNSSYNYDEYNKKGTRQTIERYFYTTKTSTPNSLGYALMEDYVYSKKGTLTDSFKQNDDKVVHIKDASFKIINNGSIIWRNITYKSDPSEEIKKECFYK